MKMKILYITLENLSLHKGSVVHVKEVVAGLKRRGHQVGLMGRAWTELEGFEGFYNLHPHRSILAKLLNQRKISFFTSSLLLFIYLFRFLFQYDLVYARDYHTAIIALLPRLLYHKKLIYEINGLASEEQKLKSHSIFNRVVVFFIKRAEILAARNSDQIVSVTPQIGTYLITHFNCQPNKIKIIGNGVNTKIFHPITDKALLGKWRESLDIEMDEVVAVFVGNLARWQGVDILIESGLRLLSIGEKLRFLIVGDGPLKESLMSRVSRSEFKKEFIFAGMIDYKNIPFLINISDFCVAPFILRRNQMTGVSPLKIFEYMACGKPIVTTRVEGLEFIEEQGIGCLVEPEDVESLRKGVYVLLQQPHQRIKMGQKGFQIARENFSWEPRVLEVEKVLKELLA